MARYSTLEKVLTDVRAEARLSLNAQHNINVRDHRCLAHHGRVRWPIFSND